MSNEYMWNLWPWQQALIWIASVFTYVIIGGFTWAATEPWDDIDLRGVGSCAWPLTIVGYIMYRAATFGPRTISYLRERKRIPRAEVRR